MSEISYWIESIFVTVLSVLLVLMVVAVYVHYCINIIKTPSYKSKTSRRGIKQLVLATVVAVLMVAQILFGKGYFHDSINDRYQYRQLYDLIGMESFYSNHEGTLKEISYE